MPSAASSNPRAQKLVLVAMIFAVAMMFIDQTIVAIAVPAIDRDLSLSATGAQWIINGYLLALASLILVGGSLGDIFGERRIFSRMLWTSAASKPAAISSAGRSRRSTR